MGLSWARLTTRIKLQNFYNSKVLALKIIQISEISWGQIILKKVTVVPSIKITGKILKDKRKKNKKGKNKKIKNKYKKGRKIKQKCYIKIENTPCS